MKQLLFIGGLVLLLASCGSETKKTEKQNQDEIAFSLLQQGKYTEAVAASEKAISANDKNGNAWRTKGQALYFLKKYREATEAFNRCISISSTDYKAYSYRAAVMIETGDLAQARGDIDFAAKNMPHDYEALLRQVSIYILLREYDSCVTLNTAFIRQFPDSIETYRSRSHCYTMLRKFPEAIADTRKALALQPGNMKDLHELGFLLSETGDYNGAINTLRQSIEKMDPIKDVKLIAYAHNNIGYALLKLGQPQEALTEINRSIELLPTNSYAFRNRALVYIHMKKKTEACADLQQAVDLGFSRFYGSEVEEKQKTFCR